MNRAAWAAILVGIAAVICGIAAIPESPYRVPVAVTAGALVLIALGIGAWSGVVSRGRSRKFIRDGGLVTVGADNQLGGPIPGLGDDPVWIFRESQVRGRRAWILVGEAITRQDHYSFTLRPSPADAGSAVKYSVVRADRAGEKTVTEAIEKSTDGQVRLFPPVGGCPVVETLTLRVVT